MCSIYRLVEVVTDTWLSWFALDLGGGGLLTDIGNVLAVLCPSSPTNAGFCCNVFMLLTLQSVREEKSSVSCHQQCDTNREFSPGSLAQLFSAEL